MPTPRTWEVWTVPFPYTDRLAEKRRPVVVISRDRLLQEHGLVWVAMITSTRTPAGAGDIEISDLAATGLAVPSRIRAAKIATVEPSRFINLIGQLSVLELLPLSERFKRYLAR